MKISELTADIIKDYCGISDNDSDDIIMDTLFPAAKEYITSYTGLSETQCEEHEDLTLALMILVNDMYSEREGTISVHKKVSPTVSTILGMHAVNYL